jgi:hypothetical protein
MTDRRQTSYLDAALAMLQRHKRPMTSREITDEAIRRGLLQPRGKTPEATMTARLYVYVRDDPSPRLRRVYEPGPNRARRGSARWDLVKER